MFTLDHSEAEFLAVLLDASLAEMSKLGDQVKEPEAVAGLFNTGSIIRERLQEVYGV